MRWRSSRSAAASPAGPVDVIRNDDAVGTRQAVEHLVGLGHNAIAYVDGGANPGASNAATATARPWPTTAWTPRSGSCPVATPRTTARAAAGQLLADRLPDAVIAANDLCAVGLLDAVLRAGCACRTTCPSSGTTTPASVGCRGSTSRRSGRTSPGWRGWR